VANAHSAETERRAGLLHASLRFGTLDAIVPANVTDYLHGILATTADLGERIGRDFLGHSHAG
jgi:hypothetical protein